MKYVLTAISCSLLFSCSDSFVNHKVQAEKVGDCTDYSKTINMISNINGERYEFMSCIDDNFDEKNYTLVRKGDSIMVDFPKTKDLKKSLFKLILDVDAKPGYNHIFLDGREVNVVPAEK
jgi:hypothetical protein